MIESAARDEVVQELVDLMLVRDICRNVEEEFVVEADGVVRRKSPVVHLYSVCPDGVSALFHLETLKERKPEQSDMSIGVFRNHNSSTAGTPCVPGCLRGLYFWSYCRSTRFPDDTGKWHRQRSSGSRSI